METSKEECKGTSIQESEEKKTSFDIASEQNFKQEILSILRTRMTLEKKKEAIRNYHDNDIASALTELTAEEKKRFYRLLDVGELADIFSYLETETAAEYLAGLDPRFAVSILEQTDVDDVLDWFRELDEAKRAEFLRLMSKETREEILLLASYGDNTIGSWMTTNYLSIPKTLTVKQAMRALVEQAAENDNIMTLYVLEEDESFYGAIDLRDLITARADTPLSSIITTSYPWVYAGETVAGCIERIKEYSEDSIPVLDENRRMVGVITATDVIEAVDEELSEDFARFAGLSEQSDLNETVLTGMRKRLPWLAVLLLCGLGVSTVVGAFENVIQGLTLIVCFQSLILGMAGNAGTQSLAVTIRVLMDEEIHAKEKLGLLLREAKVGLGNGCILGVISFGLIGCYIAIAKHTPWGTAFLVSGCIGLALMVSMLISGLVGTAIPMLFKTLGIDPAVASGPFITTVNDLVAVTAYYGLAWLLLLQLFPL